MNRSSSVLNITKPGFLRGWSIFEAYYCERHCVGCGSSACWDRQQDFRGETAILKFFQTAWIATYSNTGNSVSDPFGITSSARRLNFAPPSSPPGSVLGKQGGCMEPDFTISPWHRWIFQCQHIKPRGTTWPAKQSSKLCSKKYQRILDGM